MSTIHLPFEGGCILAVGILGAFMEAAGALTIATSLLPKYVEF